MACLGFPKLVLANGGPGQPWVLSVGPGRDSRGSWVLGFLGPRMKMTKLAAVHSVLAKVIVASWHNAMSVKRTWSTAVFKPKGLLQEIMVTGNGRSVEAKGTGKGKEAAGKDKGEEPKGKGKGE